MSPSSRIITDSIHGDIHLSELEHDLVETATFQRLRRIKQLAMGHLTYPNATHTRFAHSLGVLRIMQKVLGAAEELNLDKDQKENLRLSALLHDIGHYPYSHLMELVDKVILMEDLLNHGTVDTEHTPYPNHEDLGKHILTHQKDILDIIGSEKAQEVANLFKGDTAKGKETSLLIHSSLDMDRLDYLLRDSTAAGVPYGAVDINYL